VNEQYRLTDQITRSSRSISPNISEGYGRYHYKESKQGCRIARGSLMETLDHLIVALDEGYITDIELVPLRAQYDQCLKLINGYIKYLNGNPGLGDA
jgi:four helix bundle protein